MIGCPQGNAWSSMVAEMDSLRHPVDPRAQQSVLPSPSHPSHPFGTCSGLHLGQRESFTGSGLFKGTAWHRSANTPRGGETVPTAIMGLAHPLGRGHRNRLER
jgi:hypothetical protein